MAEENTQTTQSPVEPAEHKVRNINAEWKDRQPTTQTTEPILGKFKTQEDLIKAYQEAEGKISEYGNKYKDYDDYSAIGKPTEIQEALTWARNMKQALDSGLLVDKRKVTQTTQPTQPQVAPKPWDADDWAYKSAGEQAAAMTAYTQSEVQKYVDGIAAKYGEQLNGLRQMDGREKSILMRVMREVAKNPSLDPDALLTETAQLAAKSPEELIEMVLSAKSNTPESRKAEMDKLVAERVAEEIQKRENSQFADITVSKRPKVFGNRGTSREQENRSILESLNKQGIKLL